MITFNSRRFIVSQWCSTRLTRMIVRGYRFFDDRPVLMRALIRCAGLRRIWRLPGTVIVTGDSQVRAVFTRDDDFPLPDDRSAKFLTGAFLLGMNRTPQHATERAALVAAVRPSDLTRVHELCVNASREYVEECRKEGKGRLDIVTLSNRVGAALLQQYFGVPASKTVPRDLRRLGAMIASPRALDPRFRDLAARSAERIVAHVRESVSDAFQRNIEAGDPAETVADRLVQHARSAGNGNVDIEAVRRNMTGVLLPGSALVTRAFTLGFIQLRRKPTLWADARQSLNDRERLERCMLEALRFHPVFPILPRYSPRETTLPGRPEATVIPAGTDVLVAPCVAMMDRLSPLFAGDAGHPSEAKVRQQRELYLHFGGGAHECLGKFIAMPQIAAMLRALLELSITGMERRPTFHLDDCITPRRFVVTF